MFDDNVMYWLELSLTEKNQKTFLIACFTIDVIKLKIDCNINLKSYD